MESRPAIRLGIDFGSTTCRAAYVHPGGEKVVVPVPLPLEQFQPCFPIIQVIDPQDRYTSRFFPSLAQRLAPDFQIGLRGRSMSSRDIAAELIERAIREAEAFAGRSIESLMLCAPMTLNANSQTALTRAIAMSQLPGELRTDVEAACEAFRQTELKDSEHTTVLVLSAGYTGLGAAAFRVAPRGSRMLAKGGDVSVLAGNILDFQIMHATLRLLRDNKIVAADTASSVTPWTIFRHGTELAKESIGDGESFQIRLPEGLVPETKGGLTLRLSGAVFRRLINEHVSAALDIVAGVLEDSGIKDAELNHVILNGGTTHLPDVARRMKERFPQSKVHHLPPDAVASGAALLAMESSGTGNDDGFLSDDTEFMPDVSRMSVPGLVELVGHASAPAPEPPPPPEVVRSPEQIELSNLAARIGEGAFDGCSEELALVARQIEKRIRTLKAG